MHRRLLHNLVVSFSSNNCPLCGKADSIGHMLGECSKPIMKSMFIERHNKAARMALKCILEGSKASNHVIVIIGSKETMKDPDVYGDRVPHFLLSDHEFPGGSEKSKHMRPDILMV